MTTAQFPTLTVWIGFQTNNTSSILFFDDDVYGMFDIGSFASTSVGSTGAWVNVSADVRSMTITSGRQRQIETFPAGTCSFVLDNNSSDYDPDNTASAYVVSGVSTVTPMRPVIVRAHWNGTAYNLFSGYIDSITPQSSRGYLSDQWVTINCSDGQKVLQNVKLANVAAPQELSGSRVNRILTAAGWPTAARTLATGDVMMGATTLSNSAWQEIQSTVDAEYGRCYLTPAGKVKFESRGQRNTNQTSTITWQDSLTSPNLLASDIDRTADDDLIRNQVTITRTGGTDQTQSDTASQTKYGLRTFSASNLPLQSDSDANELAKIYIYQFKQVLGCRINGVTFEPLGDPTNLWPEVLARKISDRINVAFLLQVVGTITTGAYVEGVSHNISVQPVQNWTTTFHASRKPDTPLLEFDDTTFGILQTTSNTFGY